jgi:hypothetical protein
MMNTFEYALVVIRDTIKDGFCYLIKKLKINLDKCKRRQTDPNEFKKYQ